MRFVVVTGMSGAGKSQAVNALEDIGYYCVDNMPPKLLVHFFLPELIAAFGENNATSPLQSFPQVRLIQIAKLPEH